MRSAAMLGGALLVSACGATSSGTGVVEGHFTVPECTAGDDRAFDPYRFEAQHLVTKRVLDHLEIVLLEYPVDVEETDGLVLQFESVAELRAARAAVAPGPLSLAIRAGASRTRLALSLFQTCPRRPTLHAISGTVTFSQLTLAEKAEDTGIDEVVTGVLTASVSGPDRTLILGTIHAEFDFIPQNAPLLTPR